MRSSTAGLTLALSSSRVAYEAQASPTTEFREIWHLGVRIEGQSDVGLMAGRRRTKENTYGAIIGRSGA